MRVLRGALPIVFGLVLVAAACSNDDGGGGGGGEPQAYDPNAEGEGALSLIGWPGYTEDDWVTPFEQESGCEVTVKPGNTSDEMVNLMRQQGGSLYDGVSASGDASNRLIANGDVAPIDTSSFPDYADVMPSLQSPPHNTVDSVHYGVPYVWGPNLLMFNTDVVSPAPTSWSVVFEGDSPYAGMVTAYDSPIYIADAAMYLMSTNPDLGITDPYELTQDQLDAAVEVLKTQAGMIGKYWAVYTDEIDGFSSGDMVVGTAWPVNWQYEGGGHPGRDGHPLRGRDRMGRHVDDVLERAASRLHAQVDGVHTPSRRADSGRGVLRGHALEHRVVCAADRGSR
jgi:putative spermidine/putrescine transport system substrate-binding protein